MHNLSTVVFSLSLSSGNKSNNEIDGFHLSLCYQYTASAKFVGGQEWTEKGVSFFNACYEGPPCESPFFPFGPECVRYHVAEYAVRIRVNISFQLLRGPLCIISNCYQWRVRLW